MTDKDIDFLYNVFIKSHIDNDYNKIFIEKIKLVYDQKELSKQFNETREKLDKLNSEK